MSKNEHVRSDSRKSFPDDAPQHACDEEGKANLTVPGFPGTSQLDCRAEQNNAMNTTRENAIASLIVLANIVPVYYMRIPTSIMLITDTDDLLRCWHWRRIEYWQVFGRARP